MHRTARATALCPMSGIRTVRPPRGGWHREDPSTGGDGGAPGHNNGGGTDTGKAGDTDQDASKAPKIEGDFDPERARTAIAAARTAEAKAKVDKKAADDRVAAVLKAAGLTPDGKQDPEEQVKELLTRATAAEERAQGLATRDAVRTASTKHGADAELLLDSQRFTGKLADLDTTAADFADKVAELVKAEVKANPRMALQSPGGKGPGKQGADHGGPGAGDARKPKSLHEAIAAKLGG
jgi:hypothetical protein